MNGAEMIALERKRQVDEEGFHPGHDMGHKVGMLAKAAVVYLVHGIMGLAGEKDVSLADFEHIRNSFWPWSGVWWKPKDPIRNLVRAGALIAAEIDRYENVNGTASVVTPRQMPPSLADLTFDPRGKTSEQLWTLVREACRSRSDSWRAYEWLYADYGMRRRAAEQMEGEWFPTGTGGFIHRLQEAIYVLSPQNAPAIIKRAETGG